MDIQTITNWANQNQGLLAIILFLVSLIISWIFGKFHRSNTPFIHAGRDIKAGGNISVGNKTFIQKGGKNSRNIQGENITLNKYDDDK